MRKQDINPETVKTYIKEATAKLERFHADIEMYEHMIQTTKRDITTMEYFLDQYHKTLELLAQE
jgi:hypothetical protein